MSPDQLAAIGAFLSGAGSVLGAVAFIRSMRKRMEKQCQERIADIRRAYREGAEIAHHETDSHRDTDAGTGG